MKIELYCTQSEFEKAKEACAEGYFPCSVLPCPFGADDGKCYSRCPLAWMDKDGQLVYLVHHIH